MPVKKWLAIIEEASLLLALLKGEIKRVDQNAIVAPKSFAVVDHRPKLILIQGGRDAKKVGD